MSSGKHSPSAASSSGTSTLEPCTERTPPCSILLLLQPASPAGIENSGERQHDEPVSE
ncbi:hypothetical protein F2Q70_00038794 [Brassica cretica]|uniref:Uncharacterized protein n=1 Tax=Brassica cretica TaxID=69181 RepID=A0A8S9KBB5_BRACR|nr:hypothetical protein F2Q70_00038794 [Brassica cretica]KAF2617377.1 hypothetical protein F2Q68_00039467 [Brassica cretica]